MKERRNKNAKPITTKLSLEGIISHFSIGNNVTGITALDVKLKIMLSLPTTKEMHCSEIAK